MRADIDAQLTAPHSASVWHHDTKFQQNPSKKRKWRLSEFMSRYFSGTSRMYGFKTKRKRKAPKDAKLRILQNGYLGLPFFFCS